MAETTHINKIAVAVATVANWALSVAWYATFGTTWAELTGTPPEWEFRLDKVLIGLGFNFLMALGVAVVLRATQRSGATHGALWGSSLPRCLCCPHTQASGRGKTSHSCWRSIPADISCRSLRPA